jgi:N-acylneuraminate cytidylyltransferase
VANIAIIPARGGSKRIPRKNIKDFLGKPIIAYSIGVAISSGLFDEVMVSTDDLEIAEIAKNFGAKVPFLRTAQTANDYAVTYEVIEEVLLKYLQSEMNFDYTCCLYPCAPFITQDRLIETLEILKNEKFDSVFPVTPFGFPVQRALKLEQGNKVGFFFPEFSLSRSQDLNVGYHDAGQFYWLNTDSCLRKKKIMTDNSGGIIISEMEAHDIDDETDWKLAEMKYELLQRTK